MKMGRTGPLVEPRCRPQVGKSGDPRSQNTDKIIRLQNAKEIWDTLIDMHEGTESVKESKLDVFQSQLDKFKRKDGEGVAKNVL